MNHCCTSSEFAHCTRQPKERRSGAILIVFAPIDLSGSPPRFSKRSIRGLCEAALSMALRVLDCIRVLDCVSSEILPKNRAIEAKLFFATLVFSWSRERCRQFRSDHANPTKAKVSAAFYCAVQARGIRERIGASGGAPVEVSSLHTQES
jgi:hypothetical protein